MATDLPPLPDQEDFWYPDWRLAWRKNSTTRLGAPSAVRYGEAERSRIPTKRPLP